MSTSSPLVVDLDGTLTPSNTLWESVLGLMRKRPLILFVLPFLFFLGRARFKHWVVSRYRINCDLLPYRQELLHYLSEEKTKGRQIVLATAANQAIADDVARHCGLFDLVLASSAHQNLRGLEKLKAIQDRVGTKFTYAGDSHADVPIWRAADAAILVGVSSRFAESIRPTLKIEKEFSGRRADLYLWVQALRVHQWLKNLLLFVPLMTGFAFLDTERLSTVLLAFIAFSLAASSTYLVNDLLDIESDRAHPRKKNRPFANARLSVPSGLLMAITTSAIALVIAYAVSWKFFGVLLVYVALSWAYNWRLKQQLLIDVLLLSILYTLRILAGSVAVDIPISSWLFAFSVFIFLSLALVKRCAELVSLEYLGLRNSAGRDYRVTDLAVLWPLGVGAALSSIVVFGFFINATETQSRYATPQLLWLVALALIYWLSRLWVMTARGEMHDDPVVFAIRDGLSRHAVGFMVIVTLLAHYVSLDSPV